MLKELSIILGIISMIGYGLSKAFLKDTVQKMGSRRVVYYQYLLTVPVFILLFLVFRASGIERNSFDLKYALMIFAIASVNYVQRWLFYKAIQIDNEAISLLGTIVNSSFVLSVILSILFYNERASIYLGIAVFLTFLGVYLSVSHQAKISKKKGVIYALVSALLLSITTMLIKIPVMHIGSITTGLIGTGSVLFWASLNLFVFDKSYRKPEKIYWDRLILVAGFGVIGTIFFNIGMRLSNVSLIVPLSYMSPLVTLLFARLWYKERLTKKQYTAIGAITAAVMVLLVFV